MRVGRPAKDADGRSRNDLVVEECAGALAVTVESGPGTVRFCLPVFSMRHRTV